LGAIPLRVSVESENLSVCWFSHKLSRPAGIRLRSSSKLWGGMIPAVRCTLDRVPFFCGAKVDLVPGFPIWECKGSTQYGTPRALTRMGIRDHGGRRWSSKGTAWNSKILYLAILSSVKMVSVPQMPKRCSDALSRVLKTVVRVHGRDLHIASGTLNPSASCPVKAAWR